MEQGGDLIAYYAAQAAKYENIYHRDDPVRQSEQQRVAQAMKAALADRFVLEVACGTGYWTQFLADAAKRIVATDVTPPALDIARRKGIDPQRVSFEIADAYNLAEVEGEFDGGLAAFWLSHVPHESLASFLKQLHARLAPGAVVFMVDSVYAESLGGDVTGEGGGDIVPGEDTYKRRSLDDGTQYHVLKNYFTEDQLRDLFADTRDVEITTGTCFWWVTYVTPD